MHYDKKVALALGVLLVGAVAAFFFRRESNPLDNVPVLADSKSLDDKIADKPVRPYESHAPAVVKKASASRTKSGGGSQIEPYEEAFPRDLRVSQRHPLQQTSKTGSRSSRLGPPEPITTGRNVAKMPSPDPNSGWTMGGTTRTPAVKSKAVPQKVSRMQPNVEGYRVYRVQSGDTLSGIAHKMLGDARRYGELYEVNHNVLRSPNDLRPGMLIRIPTATAKNVPPPPKMTANRAATIQPEHKQTGQVRQPDNRSADRRGSVNGSRKFIPVRRSPFILRNRAGIPQSNRRRTMDDADRRLSQGTGTTGSGAAGRKWQQAKQAYVVQRGDSLEKIAVRFYGSRSAVSKIMQANPKLDNPRRLYPGMEIALP